MRETDTDMSSPENTDLAAPLTILPATMEHISHIIMLAHRIWPESYAGILTQEQIDNMLLRIYSPENLQKEMAAEHQFWIAYRGHKPAAFSSVYKEGDIIWLRKLYVDPAAQGQRIGVQLMFKAVSSLLPATEIRLLANPHNTRAHGFYTHLGFSKVGEIPVKMGDWDFVDFIFAMPLRPDLTQIK